MKTYKITLTALLLLSISVLKAQPIKFVTDAVIEYDKTVNMHAAITRYFGTTNTGLNQQFLENYKKTQPQFVTMKSTLSVAKDKSLFTPIELTGIANSSYLLYSGAGQFSTVYTDLATSSVVSQKNVGGEMFLLKDSTKAIKWKITDETRDILGFPCRRANGIMMDSVYVVAFYTDDIPFSGGPESFNGLPGMILQVALPHQNKNWVATKITESAPPALKVPAKGKVVTPAELKATLRGIYKVDTPQTQQVLQGILL